mgnify:FL=1
MKILFKTLIVIFIFVLLINLFPTKEIIYKTFPNLKTDFRKHLFKKKSMINNLKNDYNIKFIPETEFLSLNFVKKKITFNKNFYEKRTSLETFYVEIVDENIILIDYLGGFYNINSKELLNDNFSAKSIKKINSNLKVSKVLDSFIYKKNLYISFIEENEYCNKFKIAKAELKLSYLDFNNIFQPTECGNAISSGKITSYKHKNNEGLLVSVAEHLYDKPNNKPQKDSSIYGKILFFDLNTKNYIIFSKGHRNISGIVVKDKKIISTEHGPRSGDEINKIVFNKNYGWPIASYGEKYIPKDKKKTYYVKDHGSLGFEDPIFVFVPAIGISEIIELPNNFSNFFQENFIIASLNGRSIHRVKFDNNYNKIIFNEKIFIGQRIRDLKYSHKLNGIIMTLEEKGEIGIITNSEKSVGLSK